MSVSNDNVPIMVKSDLEGAGAYINGRAAEMAQQLASLASKLTHLQATWTGVAAVDYQQMQMQWNTAANGLFGPDGVLGQIANAMHVNWGNYSGAEFANIGTWRPQ